MFRDEFKSRYTTIPFAIYRAQYNHQQKAVISHSHKEIEIIALTEGEADFYVDARLYKLQMGDVLIIPPFAVHRAEILSDTVVSYNCICFDLSLLWDEEIKAGLLKGGMSVCDKIDGREEYTAKIQEWIELGCRACERQGGGWELEAIGGMSAVFGILKREGYFKSDLQHRSQGKFVQSVMNYITDNYASAITSSTAAAELYMNNSYFCRAFKKSFGCCFSDYVLAYRLEKTKAYLETTSDKVTEILFRVGFNSCSYFSKAFKQRFGCTPVSYRRNRRS